jgi:SET domain-containing protein
VYALVDLEPDEYLLEYGGQRITWEQANAQYAASDDPSHTYFFDLGDGTVIDGGREGNTARWLNHGCDPNCEAVDVGGRIEFRTRRAIKAGEELLIDYGLQVDDPTDPDIRALYACGCKVAGCRGIMLAP